MNASITISSNNSNSNNDKIKKDPQENLLCSKSHLDSLATISTHERISTPKIVTTAPDEPQRSPTPNVHGYIACSSENNMVEINLRFPKCKCKEVLAANNQDSNDFKQIVPNNYQNETIESTNELKKRIINFNHDNLKHIINGLDIETCTNCNISLDIKTLLSKLFSCSALDSYCASNQNFRTDGSVASKSPCISDGNISTSAKNDEFIIFNLNKKRGSDDRRSTGTQSDNPLKSKKNVIVITDEFKKKATEHQITIKKMKNKRSTLSKSMETLSTPELEQRKFLLNDSENGTINDSNIEVNNKMKKGRSKSVDDISTSSNEMLEGVDSVELIFISDEFLHKANKQQPEVIIVNDPTRKISTSPLSLTINNDEKALNGNQGKKRSPKDRSPKNKSPLERSPKESKDKKLYVISDEFKSKSLNNTVIVVKQKAEKKTKDQLIKEQSINIKTTATNSNSFLTYEEPNDDLESKKID